MMVIEGITLPLPSYGRGSVYSRPKIDSLKIRIPLERVRIVDKRLNDDRYVIDGDGEVLETFKAKRLAIKEHGITTSYAITRIGGKDGAKDFLLILLNAKLMRHDYFEGLDFERAYGELMSQGIVNFELSDFMSAKCTDIDICFDMPIVSENQLDELLNTIRTLSVQSSLRDVGYRNFHANDNKGIEYGRRENGGIAHPFFKIYAKHLELKRSVFRTKYLNFDVVDLPILRFEFTFKDSKHLANYGVENSVANLAAFVNSSGCLLALSDMFRKWVYKAPSKRLILNCQADILSLSLLAVFDMNLGLATDFAVKSSPNKQMSYSIRERLKRVWYEINKQKGLISEYSERMIPF